MINSNRRTFIFHVVATGAVLSAGQACAQTAGPKLEESDAQATALGYKSRDFPAGRRLSRNCHIPFA